ncbi:MAG: ROK family protein [Bacteroidia bacterium]|nr:ROK family protein [Bacteroidia bacterium]
MKEVAIGIDIGGTNTKYGIVDRNGKLLADSSHPTVSHKNIEDYIDALIDAILNLSKSIGEELDIKGIGIGAPNANYFTGTIEYAPNLPWKGVIPLVEMIKERLNTHVFITNDANAAAIGERVYGAAKGMDNFAVVTLGTGVGSGFVSNGKLIYGHDGFAGEFGHVTAVRGGRACTCGKRGCVETYAAARGLVLTVQEELAATQDDTKLRHILAEKLTPKDIFDAAEAGDQVAKHAFEYTGKILGESLADMVAFLSPKAIFIFGGVAKAGDWILEPTKRHMERNLLKIYKNKIDIIPSGLPDSDAAILGASALVWDELGLEELV